MTALIELRDVKKHYPVPHESLSRRIRGRHRVVKAVDGVSFEIEQGASFGLIGESGCGKSTMARLVLGLETPTSGSVFFRGRDLAEMSRDERKAFRRSVSAVFQDPWGSLNPWLKVGDIVGEPIVINESLSKPEIESRIASLLEDVGLRASMAARFPHELSGGQRQRVVIARALALSPDLIVLDEPVSALDVSIRGQVMNLLKSLQEEHGFAYLLIAHDLTTVRFFCRSLAVAYLGRLVEVGEARQVIKSPLHPYMEALVAASLPPTPGDVFELPAAVEGEPPSPINPPVGCHFAARCKYVMDKCFIEYPALEGDEHLVRCFLHHPPGSWREESVTAPILGGDRPADGAPRVPDEIMEE